MDFITLATMSRAESPTGAKGSKLHPMPFNTHAVATNIAKNISDRFGLFHNCDPH